MKFTQLLNETYYKTIKVNLRGLSGRYPTILEIFKNPSQSEIMYMIKASKNNDWGSGVRMGITKNGDIYAWDGGTMHDLVHNHIPFDIGLIYDVNTPISITSDTVYKKDWDKFKQNKKVEKKLKILFPKAERLDLWDMDIPL